MGLPLNFTDQDKITVEEIIPQKNRDAPVFSSGNTQHWHLVDQTLERDGQSLIHPDNPHSLKQHAGHHLYGTDEAYSTAGLALAPGKRSPAETGASFKLQEGRIRLATRKKLLTLRVVRHWHRMPREAVDAPSLAVFKARLDGALSKLV